MAHRKGWADLTPTYRARLERSGVTRSEYEAGGSIKAARGHGRTPEHGQKSTHIQKRGNVVEQWIVGHRGNGRWYRSDLRRAILPVKPNEKGLVRLAITGTLIDVREVGDTARTYKGKVVSRTQEGVDVDYLEDATVGVKIDKDELLDAIDRYMDGPYTVDMASVAAELTTQPFTEVTELSIATGAPPQGKYD